MLSLAIDGGQFYAVAVIALAGFWAVEHFLIQASLFESPPITKYPWFYQSCRFGFNFLSAVFILAIAQSAWLLALIGLDFLLCLVVIAYQRYFHRPFRPLGSIANFREGFKASSFAIRIIPPRAWMLLAGGLSVKLGLAFFILQQSSNQPEITRFWMAILSLGILCGMVLLLQRTSFRFGSIRHTTMTRMVYAYGYSLSWLADGFLSPNAEEVAAEVEELRKSFSSRLEADAIGYGISGHVVILQLESLDWNILNFSVNGTPVTPFLNGLAAEGQLFKVAAYHDQGSADMDYAVLSGGIPSKRILSYNIEGLTYPDSLPRFMSQQGFKTRAFHGATGSFFNRRSNFGQMGWDEICFREELDGEGVVGSYWGIRDKEVFRVSAEKLQQASAREFHFIITLDSHGPFDLIGDEEKNLFPNSTDWQENYFNSMAALDQHLHDYVQALPPDTLVMLYGDHTSGVNHGDFTPARDGTTEYVPCIIHKRTTGNSQKPSSIDSTKLPTDLSILDIIHRVRQKVVSPL